MNIRKLMSPDVMTCSPTDTLNRAAQLMWENDCGFLPVVDAEGHAVGVVTDRDLCMGAYTQGVPLWGAPVSSVMSSDVRACGLDDDIADVERTMREARIRRIPVLDGSRRVLGVLTLGDIARASQSNTLQKATAGPAVARTLAVICEPRAPQQEVAAE
jgi:CBS domain-containing protein